MNDIKDFDHFWIAKGQELVEKTFTNLNKHLSNYATYLKYLQGFFIVGGLTAEAFYKSTNPYVFASFLLPLIVLYIATFKISVSRKVELKTLDLRSPLKINATYNKLAEELRGDVKNAKDWVAYATVIVLIGGSLAIYNLNKENKENLVLKAENEIIKEYKKGQKLKVTSDAKGKMTIEAKFAEEKIVEIGLITSNNKTINKIITIPALCEYKLDIDSVKTIIETTIK